jgi:alpha-1,2-mannosyltransferase
MRRPAWNLLALAALYAAVVIPISLHKGSDFDIHLEQVQLLLAHRPVYAAPPPFGTWWPPLPLLALAPFAWLAHASVPLAKGGFALVNVACLALAVARARERFGGAAWLALAAVAVPLQTNFEYLNLNAALLALLMLAVADLSTGAPGAPGAAGGEVRAGVWIGLMTALKVFPGLLFAYLAYRRQWRGVALGIAVALSVTLIAAALPWGPSEGFGTLRRWSEMSVAAVAQMHGRSQSLPALLFRAGVPLPWQTAIELGVLALVLLLVGRRGEEPGAALGILMLVAVFLSPVAHTHYYVLTYPAWGVLLTRPPAVASRIVWYAALGVGGVLTSGFLTLGAYEWRRALLDTGIYAWGAVLLLILLLLPRPESASRDRTGARVIAGEDNGRRGPQRT